MATPRKILVIPKVEGPVDLVVLISPNKTTDDDYNELRFVLRSFEKNFARRGRVFIVGEDPPAWLKLDEVIHLPVKDRHGWKDYNIINKVKTACESGVSKHFIFCSDDQFLMRPSEPSDFWPRDEGHVTEWTDATWEKKLARKRVWYERLKHTAEVLQKRGKDVYNFDSHHPVLMDAELFPQVVTEFGYDDPSVAGKQGFAINSLYFNAIDAVPLRVGDLHRSTGELPPAPARFWNVNQHEHWPQAYAFLKERFPNPSRYEDNRKDEGADDSVDLTVRFIAERQITTVCEFGSGESTGAFLKAGCRVISFETNEDRLDAVAEENGEPELLEGVVYKYPNIPVERMTGEMVYVDGPVGRKSNGREMPIAKAAELRFRYVAVHDAHRAGEAANIRKYLGGYRLLVDSKKLQIFEKNG